MKIGDFTISKVQIAVTAILLLGLIAGMYLVQRTQILKPRATTGVIDLREAFRITNERGEELNCAPAQGDQPVTCTTDSLNVNISVKNLQELLK